MAEQSVIVIGSGPGGYVAAIRAAQNGIPTTIIEKGHTGGTCLNVGCIPTKTFLRSSRLFAECRNGAAFGVDIPSAEFNLRTIVERKNRVVTTLARGVEALLKQSGVDVIRGYGRILSKQSVQVDADTYLTGNILIATGSRPAVLPIPGIDSVKVLNSTDVLQLSKLPVV